MAVAMIQTNNSHPKGVESFRHLTVETASKRVLMQTSLASDIENKSINRILFLKYRHQRFFYILYKTIL